jgi:hypothetical protein
MPFKPKIKVALVKCKRCGKTYNNPLNHTCIIRPKKPSAKAKPKARKW